MVGISPETRERLKMSGDVLAGFLVGSALFGSLFEVLGSHGDEDIDSLVPKFVVAGLLHLISSRRGDGGTYDSEFALGLGLGLSSEVAELKSFVISGLIGIFSILAEGRQVADHMVTPRTDTFQVKRL